MDEKEKNISDRYKTIDFNKFSLGKRILFLNNNNILLKERITAEDVLFAELTEKNKTDACEELKFILENGTEVVFQKDKPKYEYSSTYWRCRGGKGCQLLWTADLPPLEDQDTKSLIASLYESKNQSLIYITGDNEDYLIFELLQNKTYEFGEDSSRDEEIMTIDGEKFIFVKSEERQRLEKKDFPELKIGDVVISSNPIYKSKENFLYLSKKSIMPFLINLNKKEIIEKLPIKAVTSYLSNHSMEQEFALSKNEPDIILALCSPGEKSTSISVIHSSGPNIFWDQDLGSSLYRAIEKPGIYISKDNKMWGYHDEYNMEYDGGVDTSFEPASFENFEECGLTESEIAEHIREYNEIDDLEGLDDHAICQRYILMAKQELEENRQNTMAP